jgi:hypothetical protein
MSNYEQTSAFRWRNMTNMTPDTAAPVRHQPLTDVLLELSNLSYFLILASPRPDCFRRHTPRLRVRENDYQFMPWGKAHAINNL